MDKDLIMNQLRKIVQARGGKYKPKHDLGELSEAYKNQYEDDGSIEFEKLRTEVAQNIAQYLFGASGIKELSAVPQDAIKKVMSKLAKDRQLQIDALIKEDKYNLKALDILEKDKKKVKYLEDMKQAKALRLGDRYDSIKYPDLERYKTYRSTVNVPTKLSSKMISDIQDMFYPAKNTTMARQESENEEDVIREGNGLSGGKRKRGPSKYNMFVKQYLQKHKGHSIADAAKAWRK